MEKARRKMVVGAKISKEEREKLTQQVIMYLIKKLGTRIEGKKKIMKLMFLVEHYDPNTEKLKKEGELGNKFYIYYY